MTKDLATRPREEAVEALRASLQERLGSPAKWEMLFTQQGGLIDGACGRVDVEPRFENPTSSDPEKPKSAFVRYGASIPAVHDWDVFQVFADLGFLKLIPRFFQAGERSQYVLDPRSVSVGILIAGGPAAGLNMVTDSIVKRHFALATQMVGINAKHNVRILGFQGGYEGLAEGKKVVLLPSRSAEVYVGHRSGGERVYTDEWATDAGVRLTALRGKEETDKKAQAELARKQACIIVQEDLNILYVIGGNGTLSWATKICRALAEIAPERNLIVVGGPKTMDNDVNFTDVTFGFRTAVDNAASFIRTIHTSAESINRLGVIELFGAASGFVALHAGYISGVADYVMIPELCPDEGKVMEYLEKRMKKNKHAVLVVAEGAMADFRHGNSQQKEEAFTNFLRKLRQRFKVADVRARYLMRDTPPNSFDLDLCKWSGKLMVDTALAGFTNCCVSLWQGDYVLVPFESATCRLKQVLPWSYYLQTLLDRERLALLGSVLSDHLEGDWYG
jgi:6-phosphofructokinase 1